MKLHLPYRLRCAVISCLSALAVTTPTLATGALITGLCMLSFSTQATAADKVLNEDYDIQYTDRDNHLIFNDGGSYELTAGSLMTYCDALTIDTDTTVTVKGASTAHLATSFIDVKGSLILQAENLALTKENFSFTDSTSGRIVMDIGYTGNLSTKLHNSFKGTLELKQGKWTINQNDNYGFESLRLASDAELSLGIRAGVELTHNSTLGSKLTLGQYATFHVIEGNLTINSASGLDSPLLVMDSNTEITASYDIILESDLTIQSKMHYSNGKPIFGAEHEIDANGHTLRLVTTDSRDKDNLVIQGNLKNLKELEIAGKGELTIKGELSPESFSDRRTTLSFTPVGDQDDVGSLILQGEVHGFTEIVVPSKNGVHGSITFDSESGLYGDGTLTKIGEGLLTLDGHMGFEGVLEVTQGGVQWGVGTESTKNWGFKEIVLHEGTTLTVAHAAVKTTTNLSMNNATLEVGAPTGKDKQSDAIQMGLLTLTGENRLKWDTVESSGFAFTGITGSGNLTVDTIKGNIDAGKRTLDVGDVQNFTGVIHTELAQYTSTTGINFRIGNIHQDAGHTGKWELNGLGLTVYSSGFHKTGEGEFIIAGVGSSGKIQVETSDDFWMGYDGTLTLENISSMNIVFNSGTTLHYGGEHSIMDLATSHSVEGTLYVLADEFTKEQLLEGVNLMLKGDSLSLVKVRGRDRYDLYVEGDNQLHLRLSDDNAWYESVADDNARVIDKTPETLGQQTPGDHGLGLHEPEAGISHDAVIVTADTFADGASIFGGSATALPEEGARAIKAGDDGVWMIITGGDLGSVVGGNYGDNNEAYSVVGKNPFYWVGNRGGFARSFEGDTHIIFGTLDAQDQPTASCIVGGNYGNSVINDELVTASGQVIIDNKETIATSFVGDSWISLNGGDVGWVCGGSYQTIFDVIHGAADGSRGASTPFVPDPNKYNEGSFVGDSHIFIYEALQGVTDGHDDASTDFIAGGNLIDISESVKLLRTLDPDHQYWSGNEDHWDKDDESYGFWTHIISTPFYFVGDSYIVVDLKDKYAGEENGPEFGKSIVGGDYVRNEKGWAEHIGNTYVYITGADGVVFTERIFGGNYDDGSSYTHLAGDTWLEIDSGTFRTMIVAGSNQGSLNESKGAEAHFRQALSCVVDGETRVVINGGHYTGRTSTILEQPPSYVITSPDQANDDDELMLINDEPQAESINHSVGRISIVGGNYISRGANAERNSTTVNVVGKGSVVNIYGGTFSGHIFGATVMEGNNGTREAMDGEWKQPAPVGDELYQMNKYYVGFRGHLQVGSSTIYMTNASMVDPSADQLDHDDDQYAPTIWNPRVVGGFLLHVAADNLVPNLQHMQNDEGIFKPMVKIGAIDVTIENCQNVFDVIGGSWTSCLDVSADEIRDWRGMNPMPEGDPHNADGDHELGAWEGDYIIFRGVEQGDITVSLSGVHVEGDVVAGGIQGGISKLVSDSTTVNISSTVTFDMYYNPYRPKQNIITGGYMSTRKKDYQDGMEKWDDEQDPFDTFYEAAANNAEYQGVNVSFVKGDRRLNFTDGVDYQRNLHHTIVLNFDKVWATAGSVVNVAGLLITDEQAYADMQQILDYDIATAEANAKKEMGMDVEMPGEFELEKYSGREKITLYGGGEVQLVPDYMQIPHWEVDEDRNSHTVPEVAAFYKWIHNNSYISVEGEGTTLHFLTHDDRESWMDDITGKESSWIMNGEEYDDGLLHAKRVDVLDGARLVVEQELKDKNIKLQPLAVTDTIRMNSSEFVLNTYIKIDRMNVIEDAAVREEVDWYPTYTPMPNDGARPDLAAAMTQADHPAPANNDTLSADLSYYYNAETGAYYDKATDQKLTAVYEPGSEFTLTMNVDKTMLGKDFYKYLVDYVNAEAKENLTFTRTTQEQMKKWFSKYHVYGITVEDEDIHMKYFDPEGNVEQDGVCSVVIYGRFVTAAEASYYEDRPHTPNGKAGAELIDDYYPEADPDDDDDRNKVVKRLDELIVNDLDEEADRLEAAVAGSSLTTLGLAFADDVDRQLRGMRNRAYMGMGNGPVYSSHSESDGGKGTIVRTVEHLPSMNLWVNAEGDYRRLQSHSTDPGYKLTSWGGTVGAATSTRNGTRLGLALTAMYGDYTSDGPDKLKADMDTYYLSAFMHETSGSWSHVLVGTVGLMKVDGTRTVDIGGNYGSYSTGVSTDGWAMGLLYEIGYSAPLGDTRHTVLQPIANIAWRHVALNGFTESGSSGARLCASKQTMDSFIPGAGLRMTTSLSPNLANTEASLEAHALVKGYLGDERCRMKTGFTDRARRATIRSNEQGRLGIELGAGVTVPLHTTISWQDALFMDVSTELRTSYTNFNAVIGYKVSF